MALTKSKLTLEYIAGYMDGEGTFAIVKSTDKKGFKRFSPRVSVGSTDLEILEDISELLGCGYIYRTKSGTNKQFYSLEFGKRKNVMKVCCVLIPYLRQKLLQAEILISFCNRRENKLLATKNNRYSTYEKQDEDDYLKIKELKHA